MRRIGYILLVVALVATHMTLSTERADAATTGSTTEVATLENTVNFVDLEVDEVQSLYNNATGGTFTLTLDGVGPTDPIAYNALPGAVEIELETLSNVGDITVTGAGVMADPWLITFPGTDAQLLQPDSSALVGGTSTVAEVPPQGRSAPIDAAGVAYLGDNLLVSDSEVDEEDEIFHGVDLWEMTLGASIVATGLEPTPPGVSPQPEPTGLAYNATGEHVYISRDNAPPGVTDITPGGDGVFGTGDDNSTFLRGRPNNCSGGVPFCIADPEDVAWDTAAAQLFIVAGIDNTLKNTLTAVKPGVNGSFDGLPVDGGDDVFVGTWSLPSVVVDAEGLGYRASTDTLLVADRTTHEIYEITKTGHLIRTIDIETAIGSAGLNPSDVVLAPPSASGGGLNLYVTDRGIDNNAQNPAPRDGRMFELSTDFANLAPFVSAGPDKTVKFGSQLTLTGDSYDDGQPTTAAPTVTWSKDSGPGTVTFGSPNSLTTNVSFSSAGTYVLKLSSTDGDETSEDTVQVQVHTAPTVSAGPDRTITLPASANLGGSVSDDGLPNPPGSVTVSWSKVTGPGTVSFGNVNSPSTTASFSKAGDYVLRLTANDGALQTSDTMTVVVKPAIVDDPNDDSDSFLDDNGHTFEADIEWLANEGITKGCNPPVNNLFCPDDFVTRGQMAAFLHRALDDVLSPTAVVEFIDDDGNTFEADIEWLGGTGVTKGCNPPTNDRYCPDDFVTRGQMAAFLVRALGYTDDGGGNLFIDDNGNTFENDIDKLATAGVTRGCNPPTNDRFCPNDFVTRGQMAAFLHRALGN